MFEYPHPIISITSKTGQRPKLSIAEDWNARAYKKIHSLLISVLGEYVVEALS